MNRLFGTLLVLLQTAVLSTAVCLAQSVEAKNEGVRGRRVRSEAAAMSDWRVIGPAGGDVRALVVDPGDAKRFYLGTLDGQIYTSADAGANWSRLVSFNRPSLYIDHIIVDPRDSKKIYVGAHRHKNPGGFFKSTDGGETWAEAGDFKGEALHSLFQSSKNPDVMVAGTNSGIFLSKNSGDNWERLPTSTVQGLINVESLAIDPRNSDVIYAGTWYLPYKSTDGGQTWRLIKNGMIDDSDVFAIDIDPRNPDHVIASACSGIYDSSDAGETWRKVQGIPSQSRRTRAILQHPSVRNVVFAGTTEGFWRSANGGSSWELISSRQLEINSIAVHPDSPKDVYIGTNNYGVMVSHDTGKTFTQSNGGFSARRAYFILPDREKPNRMYATTINTATGGGFFYVSDDTGETWRESTRNMPSRLISYSIVQDRADGNVLYVATNMGVYRSADRGESWESVGAPEQPKEKSTKGVNAKPVVSPEMKEIIKWAQEALNAAGFDTGAPDGVAGTRTVTALRNFQAKQKISQTGKIDNTTLAALGLAGGKELPANARATLAAPVALSETVNDIQHTNDEKEGRAGLFAATAAGLYRSYDLARGWELVYYGSSYDARTLSVTTSPQDPKTIWVGTAASGVLISRDGGETWQQMKDVPSIAPINIVRIDSRRPSHVYVGTGWTMYMTQDGGATWMRRGGDLPYGNYTAILINPENGDEVFVGSAYENGGGVFRSADAGMTWRRVDPQLPSRRVWTLAYASGDTSKLFVGSHSAGIYIAGKNGAGAADKAAVSSSLDK